MRTVLLHLVPTAGWRSALATGAVEPLPDVGFVHLSTPEQVALPATRLFAGRRDLSLLVLDPDRLGVEVRWEPGVPGDPESMRFPHAYGPVPTAAVVAVEPYRHGADGAFTAPAVGPVDIATRCERFEPSVVRRIATTEVPVTGGVATLTPAVAGSHHHNQLILDGPTDAATVAAEADAVLGGAGLAHRMALFVGAAHRDTALGLRAHGWTPEEYVIMAAPAGGASTGRVQQLDVETLRPAWAAIWRRAVPEMSEATITDLADRYLLQETVVDNRYLAVCTDGEVAASALLSIDGATAWLNDVDTAPEHRGLGHGDTLVVEALAVAAAAGCDVVALGADAQDWPRRWYARRGFAEVGRCWSARRT